MSGEKKPGNQLRIRHFQANAWLEGEKRDPIGLSSLDGDEKRLIQIFWGNKLGRQEGGEFTGQCNSLIPAFLIVNLLFLAFRTMKRSNVT
jgi:hypothetical protein